MSADIEEAILLELADGTIQACNPAVEKILGFRLEQMQGCLYVDCPWQTIDENGSFLSVETHPAVVALQTGQSITGVIMGSYQPNGQLVWLRVNAQPLFRVNETSPYAVVSNFTDITEERRYLRRAAPTQIPQNQIIPDRSSECFTDEQEAILEEQAQLLELAIDPIVVRDLNNNITFWNRAAEDVYGWTKEEALGKCCHTLLQTQFPQPLAEIEAELRTTGRWQGELIHFRRDGTPVTVMGRWAMKQHCSGEAMSSDKPLRVYSILEVNHDISDVYDELRLRKQIEADLQESETRFRELVNAMPQFVWVTSANGELEYVSQQWLEFSGLTIEQTRDPNLLIQAYHPDDAQQAYEEWQVSLATGQPYEVEYRFRRAADNLFYWFLVRAVPIKDEHGKILRWYGTSTEISDCKQIEAALQESEERFRQLAENIDVVFWITEMPERRISYISPAYERLWGLNRHHVYDEQQAWINMIHPEDGEAIERAFLEQAANGRFDQEYRIVLPDSRIRWVRDRCFPIKDESGKVYRFTGIAEDITERKQAQEALHSALQKLNSHVENTPMAVIEWDARLRVCRWSGAAERMFGWQAEEVLGIYINDLNIVYEKDIPVVTDVSRRILTGEEPQIICHNRNYTKNGSVIHCIWYNSTLTDASGQVTSVLSLVLDVTEQKRIEQALRESEERFRLIAENARDLICIVNEAGQYLYVSPAYERVLGYSTETLLTLNILDLTHPQDLAAIGDWHNAQSFQLRVRKEDGSWLWMEASSNQITTQEGNLVIGVARDISDRRQAETEREQLLQREQTAREQAETANRIKDEFLAVLSHELRSPLNPILGWSQLLQTRKFDREKIVQGLATIERNAKLQVQLIEDLLDISRIMRGKLVLNVAPVSLELIIASALETVRLAAQVKAIHVETHFAPIFGQVAGDAARLQQILWNLLSNAIKFTPDGGRVEIRLEQLDSYAQIQVIDTGKGISPEFLPYIFEYFRQEDATTTRQFGGLGLGLAIARQIVEMHGGSILAQSPGEGKGTTFTVRLPVHKSVTSRIEDPVIDASLLSDSSSFTLEGIQILVVDDDTDARDYFTSLLQQEQAIVTSAASAIEALQSLKKFQPDVLLCDVGMPTMDGYMLIKQIRTLPPEEGGQIPAIALTAYAGESNQKLALAAGFQLHIAKPAAPDEIVAAVNCLIGSIRNRLR